MTENNPFINEINYVLKEIEGITINYDETWSEILTNNLKNRKIEEKSYRVTSIIEYDYENKKENKNYLKTYLHDALLDVTCEFLKGYFNNIYKEKFIYSTFNGNKIKGHADFILNDKILGEIKNYTSGNIDKERFLQFVRQILIYCLFLRINSAYLIINNPTKSKKVVFLYLHFNKKTEEYITNFLNVTLSIPKIKKAFKYDKII